MPKIVITNKRFRAKSIKFIAKDGGQIIARCYLYLIENDLHKEPYGLIEDLFVIDEYRGRGIGGKLLKKALNQAKKLKCHKVICTSRYGREKLHEWYKTFGLVDHGIEFRINLKK